VEKPETHDPNAMLLATHRRFAEWWEAGRGELGDAISGTPTTGAAFAKKPRGHEVRADRRERKEEGKNSNGGMAEERGEGGKNR